LEALATGSSSLFAFAGAGKSGSGMLKRWHKSTAASYGARRFATAQRSSALPERLHLKQWNWFALVLTLKHFAVPLVEPCKGQHDGQQASAAGLVVQGLLGFDF